MKKQNIIEILIINIVILGIWLVINIYYVFDNNKQIVDVASILENNKEIDVLTKVKEQYNNNEIVALIEIPDVFEVTPVVQSSDNEYYLTHDVFKNYNKVGALFLDYRVDFEDSQKTIIYGHMTKKNNFAFGYLSNYLNRKYVDEHQSIIIRLKNKVYNYKVFAVTIYSDNYDYLNVSFKTEEEYINNINSFIARSLYKYDISIEQDDKTIFLQTCYPQKKGSFIVIGAKLDNIEHLTNE